MIRDLASEFSTKQDFKGNGATVVSTNHLDTQAAKGDAAVGTPIEWAVTVDTAATGGTSVNWQLFTADANTFASETVLDATGAIPVADLVKGKTISRRVPYGAKRYLRVKAVTVGDVTAINATVGLVKASDQWKPADPVGVEY